MKKVPLLHFITTGINPEGHIQSAYEACVAGVPLVQLRLKDYAAEDCIRVARAVRDITFEHSIPLIINDHTWLAEAVKADGVHLGMKDAHHAEARQRLGPGAIIGATAYSMVEAELHFRNGIADYIGLGTFRPTATKPELTAFLSLEEIRHVIRTLEERYSLKIPILVIGGIQLEDVTSLKGVGVHGVAVSSLIQTAQNKSDIVRVIIEQLEHAIK